jgi:hypothetical protein
MTTVKIGEAPFYIAMSERDKLAACRSLSLGDMGGRCWLLFERRLHPPLYDAIMRRRRSGSSPKPSQTFHRSGGGVSLSSRQFMRGFSDKGWGSPGGSTWGDRSPAKRRYLTTENIHGISCRQQFEGRQRVGEGFYAKAVPSGSRQAAFTSNLPVTA